MPQDYISEIGILKHTLIMQYLDLFKEITGNLVGFIKNSDEPLAKRWISEKDCDREFDNYVKNHKADYEDVKYINEYNWDENCSVTVFPAVVMNKTVGWVYWYNPTSKNISEKDKDVIVKFLSLICLYVVDKINMKLVFLNDKIKKRLNDLITFGTDFYDDQYKILTLICHELCLLYDVPTVKVMEFNYEKRVFKIVDEFLNKDEYPEITHFNLGNEECKEIADYWLDVAKRDTKRGHVKNYDLTDEAEMPDFVREYYKKMNLSSNFAMVIDCYDEGYQRTLCFFNNKPKDFWSSETDYLKLIVKQISLVLRDIEYKEKFKRVENIIKNSTAETKDDLISELKNVIANYH